jgi:hypothetical protein
MAEYLLFATERYALPILAPLAQALHASGQSVSAWFADGAGVHDLSCFSSSLSKMRTSIPLISPMSSR